MIIKCCVCNKTLGKKPPYSNHSITHTYCDKHYKKVLRDLEKFKASQQRKQNPPKRNPASGAAVVGVIPGRIEEIRYVRHGRSVSSSMRGPYKHKFTTPGTQMIALSDGSILIRNPRRKLWLRNNAD